MEIVTEAESGENLAGVIRIEGEQDSLARG